MRRKRARLAPRIGSTGLEDDAETRQTDCCQCRDRTGTSRLNAEGVERISLLYVEPIRVDVRNLPRAGRPWQVRKRPEDRSDGTRRKESKRRCWKVARRIEFVVLDGAMGTMIQSYKPQRGRLSRRALRRLGASDLKGNNDLLSLTRPAVIREIHESVSRGRRRHHRDQHVQFERAVDGRLRHGVARAGVKPRRRPARARLRRQCRRANRTAALRCWSARADQQDGVDIPRRQRSGLSQHHV